MTSTEIAYFALKFNYSLLVVLAVRNANLMISNSIKHFNKRTLALYAFHIEEPATLSLNEHSDQCNLLKKSSCIHLL